MTRHPSTEGNDLEPRSVDPEIPIKAENVETTSADKVEELETEGAEGTVPTATEDGTLSMQSTEDGGPAFDSSLSSATVHEIRNTGDDQSVDVLNVTDPVEVYFGHIGGRPGDDNPEVEIEFGDGTVVDYTVYAFADNQSHDSQVFPIPRLEGVSRITANFFQDFNELAALVVTE